MDYLMTVVEVHCPFCGKTHTVNVRIDELQAWENGALAQKAFPNLTPTEREALISGMCPDCQAKIFAA